MAFAGRLPAAARRAFIFDSFSGIIVGIFLGGTLPFLSVLARKELNASPFLLSLIAAAPFAGLLTSFFWVQWAEKGKKILQIVVFNAAGRALLVLLAFAYTAPIFALVVAVSQIIPTFANSAYIALIKRIYPEESRGRLTSLVRVAITLSSMFAALAVGVLLTKWSFHLILPLLTFIGVIGTLLFGFIPEPEPEKTAASSLQPQGTFSLLRSDPLFAKFTAAFFVFGFGAMMCTPVITLLQVDELHITAEWVGLLTTFATLTTTLTYYFWGRVVDRHGPIACALGAIFCWVLVFIGYAVVPNLYGLIPIALISGIAVSANELAVLNGVMYFGDSRAVPRYSGVHYTLLGVRGLISPLLGGALAGLLNLRIIFVLAAVMIFVGFLLMLQVQQMAKKRVVAARPSA